MKEYCQKKKKATIRYKFSDSMEKKYISRECPITVSVVDFDESKWDVVDRLGMDIAAYIKSGFRQIVNSKYFRNQGYAYRFIGSDFQILTCNRKIRSMKAQYPGNYEPTNIIQSVNLNRTLRCPKPLIASEIEVKHKGKVLFSDFGSKPCKYQVKCECECEDKDAKIEDDTYPGYWCLAEKDRQALERLQKRSDRFLKK